MLARQVRMLIRVKEGAEANPAELARSLNLPQWKVKSLAQQAARFSDAALKAHLALLHQVDFHLKTSTGNPRLWLEWALVKDGAGVEGVRFGALNCFRCQGARGIYSKGTRSFANPSELTELL